MRKNGLLRVFKFGNLPGNSFLFDFAVPSPKSHTHPRTCCFGPKNHTNTTRSLTHPLHPAHISTMSQSRTFAPVTPSSSPLPDNHHQPLPAYLARHINLGFDQDDISALLRAIDSSQVSPTNKTRLAHLPAELLLQILEYVPVDHVLDWRLVCKGFRDAIDGRVLYHHLHRTELIGYLGPRYSDPMVELDDEQYEKIHLMRARFKCIQGQASDGPAKKETPVWSARNALFKVDDSWLDDFVHISGAAARQGNTVWDADNQWTDTLKRLNLHSSEEVFGTLRWCIRLDHAVLDLDFPIERLQNKMRFYIHPDCYIQLDWKDTILRFLKTERALRLMLEKVHGHKLRTYNTR